MADEDAERIADTNVEAIGSAEDKAARQAAAATDSSWAGAGQKPGLEIWRVENRRTEADTPDFGVNRWPEEEYGSFCTLSSPLAITLPPVRTRSSALPGASR
jgi:hypothetical protein|eukprot:COSAG01_NODE_3433_length_6100_cov_47.049492_3_plen_102_part_00